MAPEHSGMTGAAAFARLPRRLRKELMRKAGRGSRSPVLNDRRFDGVDVPHDIVVGPAGPIDWRDWRRDGTTRALKESEVNKLTFEKWRDQERSCYLCFHRIPKMRYDAALDCRVPAPILIASADYTNWIVICPACQEELARVKEMCRRLHSTWRCGQCPAHACCPRKDYHRDGDEEYEYVGEPRAALLNLVRRIRTGRSL